MIVFRQTAVVRARAAPIRVLFLIAGVVASAQGQDGFVPAFTPASGFVGEKVVFHADPPGESREGYQFSWKFGDGSEATAYADQDSAEHVFAAPGRYAILLRFRKDGIIQSANRLLSVNWKPTAARPAASGTLIGSRDGAFLWCVNPDQNSVTRIDADKLEANFETPVGINPSGLAEGPEGLIWVANKGSATVTIVNPRTGSVVKTLGLPYASQPHGVVFSPDRKVAYVALQAIGKLAVLDAVGQSILHLVPVGPTPRALALSQDGSILLSPSFVSRQTGGEVAVAKIVAGGAAPPSLEKTVPILPQLGGDTEGNGRGVPNNLGTVAISPDGRRAFFAGKKDNVARGKARDGLALTFENTVRTTVFFLDLSDFTTRMEDRFDIDNSNLPTALIFSPRGDQLYVALEGNRQVRVLDPYNGGSELARINGTGSAPGGLLIDAERNRLYVHSLLDRQVEAYDIKGVLDNSDYAVRKLAAVRSITSETLSPQVLSGKQLFHSADSLLSRDGYVSCAVCHPDGGSDGMVWDFTDRGEGLRKTIPLTGRAGMGHGPVHWSANFDEIQDFEHDIRGPFGGWGLMTDEDFADGTRYLTLGDAKAGHSESLDALAAYVASLAIVDPSPFRDASGRMTDAALRGKSIFLSAETACASCHAGPHFTDSKIPPPGSPVGPATVDVYAKAVSTLTSQGFLLHDVGTLGPASGRRLNDSLPGLDTPTLKGIWQFPPYLHDGSAATLREVLVDHNPDDRHGKTSHLDAGQVSDLIAYLLQLDEDPESGPGAGIAGRGKGASPKGRGKAMLSFSDRSGNRGQARPLILREDGAVFEISGRKRAQPRD